MADVTQVHQLDGFLKTDTAEVTILLDGVSVFSGAVTALGEMVQGTLCQWNFTQDDSITAITDHTLSISVTSGTITAASIYQATNTSGQSEWNTTKVDRAGNDYWLPGVHAWFGDTGERTNILINGVAPSWPTIPPYPTGTEAAPTWGGWGFDLSAGETLTCTLRVNPPLNTPRPNLSLPDPSAP